MRTSASSSVSNTVGVSRRQVRAVHVVDRVGQLARDAEALRRAEARAVLDVAVLLAVKPVHAGDVVRVLADAGDDRGGAHRRHRGKRGDAVGHVAPALASAARAPAPRPRRSRARASRAPSRRSRTGRAWAASSSRTRISGAGCAARRTSLAARARRARRTTRAARAPRSRADAAARRAPRARSDAASR